MTTTDTTVDQPSATGRDKPPSDTGLDVVTGAFGFTGSRIAMLLTGDGRRVRTLTGHPQPAPEDTAIEVCPLDFDDPLALTRALEGATTLYNTYWVRFARGRRDHVSAAANSRTLFTAAQRAGVRRIVHISITHPSIESPDPYFRGKAMAERALAECGVSYGVARPGILFGDDGVLINNIAWLLRHLPVFAVGGDGDYRIRPIHVEDLARLCVTLGSERIDSIVNAVGPNRPTFLELVRTIRESVGSRARIVRVPGVAIPLLSRMLGLLVHDVLLTPDEYRSMAAGLADVDGPATGRISVTGWIREQGNALGTRYANELVRHSR
jgi:NADH dehydrogenase